MSWKTEFGDDYKVPTVISSFLKDESYRNDACPSFVTSDCERDEDGEARYKLWVEHPDPDKREFDGPRLIVSDRDTATDLYAGESPEEALRALRAASEKKRLSLRFLSGKGTEFMLFCVMLDSRVFACWKTWFWKPDRGYYGFFSWRHE